MREIFPGVRHWTVFKANIGAPVSSYLVEPAGVLVDPMVPEEGADALVQGTPPQLIVLTSGLHTRDAGRLAGTFGCPIVTSREGAERIGGELEVETYGDGDEVAPGVRAVHVGVLCPDEYALHITATEGALAIADALDGYGERLGFFPDDLLGDDPEAVRSGLRERLRTLLDLDFEHLLLAHGEPIVGRGKAAVREVVEQRA